MKKLKPAKGTPASGHPVAPSPSQSGSMIKGNKGSETAAQGMERDDQFQPGGDSRPAG